MARYPTYRCGGYASFTGHCGALDCETCHPGGAAELRRQERLEELEAELAPLRAELAELEALIEAAHERHLDTSALEDRASEIEDEIREIESSADDDYDGHDPYDYDGPDDYDYRAEDLMRYGTDSDYY